MEPGVYTLCAASITAARTNDEQTEITALDGLVSVTLLAEMLGGTGGTSISALVQTTFDGVTWLDIARFDWTNTASKKWCVLQGNAAKAIATYVALAAEGVNDGLLGNELRVVLTTVGTYTNTTVAVRAAVR